MVFKDYYGDKEGETVLEIYSRSEDDERIIHRQLRDKEAYDTWHLSYYMKEILEYGELISAEEFSITDIPRKEKNLLLYLLLVARPEKRHVVELGSSLFEMIDGLEVTRKCIEGSGHDLPNLDPISLTYTGIEISKLLASASRRLHPEYNITIVPDVGAFDGKGELLYDRSVTNYAFESADEAATFINKFDVALLNTFVSYGDTFASTRLGKTLVYFNLGELISELDQPLFHLFGSRAPGPHSGHDLSRGRPVLEAFFLCSDVEYAEQLMELSRRHPEIEAWFQKKEISPIPAERFLEDKERRPTAL